jgi:hypothetical protein
MTAIHSFELYGIDALPATIHVGPDTVEPRLRATIENSGFKCPPCDVSVSGGEFAAFSRDFRPHNTASADSQKRNRAPTKLMTKSIIKCQVTHQQSPD